MSVLDVINLGNSFEIVTIKLYFKLGIVNIDDMNIKKNAIKNGVNALVYASADS